MLEQAKRRNLSNLFSHQICSAVLLYFYEIKICHRKGIDQNYCFLTSIDLNFIYSLYQKKRKGNFKVKNQLFNDS